MRLLLPLALSLVLFLSAAARELPAQTAVRSGVGFTNYTPPSPGLVGYTNRGRSGKKAASPADLVAPPEILPDTFNDDSGAAGPQARGAGVTPDFPYLSRFLFGAAPTGRAVLTAAVTHPSSAGGGLLSDGGFIPETAPVSAYDPTPSNTYVLTTGQPAFQAEPSGGGMPQLPSPVLDTPPAGYYSAIGEDGGLEDPDSLSSFFVEPTVRRPGFFQQVRGMAEYIPNVGKRRSGMTTFGGAVRFAFPFPDAEHPLMITPHFSWTDLSTAQALEPVFGRKVGLYTGGIQADLYAPLSPCFLLNAGFGASWNSDLKTGSGDALRLTGQVVGIFKMNETARIIVGASYQNIANWRVVPVFGVAWRPHDDFYINATFPRAKAARRITWMKGIPEIENGNSPYWLYVTGELTGNRWSIRPDGPERNAWGTNALVTYYDYRILGGIEKRLTGDVNWAVEGGLVFSRHLEYEGWTPAGYADGNIHPKPAGVVRLRVDY